MGRNVESLQTDKRKDRLISEMRLYFKSGKQTKLWFYLPI